MRKSPLHIIVLKAIFVVTVVLLPAAAHGYSEGSYYGYGESTYYGYGESTYYGYGYGESTYYGYGYGQSTYYGYGYGQSGYTFTLSNSASVSGTVNVGGTLSKGSGTFVIDHPLDPKNKLLYHSFVESPDVMNIYDGIVTLDEHGEARIALPGYFIALNRDYRYLATAIGQPMPDLHVSSEVRRQYVVFGAPVVKIAGGVPNGRVSWQITGVRRDPYIVENPIVVEVEKGPEALAEQGEYLFPEFYEN